MRWLRRLLVGLGILVLIGALAAVWLVRRSFPETDGTVALTGLEAEVTITRDTDGVPHIEGANSHDLFVAQGYVHAQDRFWQMDAWRHIGAGRLAEMFGESQVETDIFLRTLGFEAIADQEYEQAPAAVKEALDAYAAGVNAYLAERPGGSALSLEYAVLGIQNSGYSPEPWEPADSLMWGHVMAWDLRANINQEIERARLVGVLGRQRTEQLYPPFPADHQVIVPSGAPTAANDPIEAVAAATDAFDRTSRVLTELDSVLGRPLEGLGSNNWVLSGDHTASGAPILANDPHLGIQMPSIWYEIDLWCREVTDACPQRVTGFSFPGAPGVVLGHNERIAWGVTNLAPDTMDLYIERTGNDGTYEYQGDHLPYEERSETIRVAGGEDVEIVIRSTRHGPIISNSYGPLDELDTGGIELPDPYEVALSWKALEPSTLFESLLEINLASDWDEFRTAAAKWDIAPQNLVYADVDGHIGYQATGEIPVRASGDGRYPVPGWSDEHEWAGVIPFEDLPSILDPPSGMIVTANQPVVDSGYDGLIGVDHSYGYRSERISQRLERPGRGWEAADMVAIQMDTFDASAAIVVPAVLALPSDNSGVAQVQDVLEAWSQGGDPFQMRHNSPGAAAYGALWRHLLAATFDDELAPIDLPAGGNGRFFRVMELLLETPNDEFWDDVRTEAIESSEDTLLVAVRGAHDELTRLLGGDGWEWGDLHVAKFENQTLGQSGIGPIEALFNRTAPTQVSGGAAIVNATSWSPPDGYAVVAVPSMRMVVDLADLERSITINTTGQSGHAFHRHYFDMAEPWTRGGTHPMRFGPAAIGQPEGVLILTP